MNPSPLAKRFSLRAALLTLCLLLCQAGPSWALVPGNYYGYSSGGSSAGAGGSPPSAPEIDPNLALGGLTLAVGGLLVLSERRA